MKIFCLFYKDEFVVGFPSREDCVEFGKKHYEGMEWDCCIKEKWIFDFQTYPQIPSPSQPIITPYTTPIPLKTAPYSPNIWCENDGPKATYEVSDVSYPFTIDYSQTPKTND